MNTHCLNDKFEVYHVESGKPGVPGTAIIKHASEDDSECIVHLFTPSGSFWSQMTLENLKNSTIYKIGKEIQNKSIGERL